MGESSLTSVDLLLRGHHKIVVICGSEKKLYSNNLKVNKTGVLLKAMNFKGYKMDGLGNDFLIIDQRHKQVVLTPAQIKKLGNRNNLGFDQLIYIEPGNPNKPKILFYNSDGSESAACGNGSRCVAYLLMSENNLDQISIETKSGILKSYNNGNKNITLDMGPPIFEWNKIPLEKKMDPSNIEIKIDNYGVLTGYALSVGNPHIIFFQSIENSKLKIVGPLIENHSFFPEKCNVTFADIIDKQNIKIKVWERGAGMTKACGTAACATAIAAHQKQLTDKLVGIHFEQGKLTIEWKSDNRIYMTGPVSEIQEVNIEI